VTRARKLGLLSALYFAQGMPFGFQVTALPIYIRQRTPDLESVGYVGLLAAPWIAKALWAPLVDRFWSPALGRRRSWILPLQLGLVLTCAFTALVHQHLPALLLGVFLLNLFAATQDIAVDGLALDLLREEELGVGNSAQVCGYLVGMIVGGGVLVNLSITLDWGWKGVFLGMGALTALVSLLVLAFREPPLPVGLEGRAPPARLADILVTLRRALSTRAGAWLIVFLLTYRAGESMVDAMAKPFLYDVGFTPVQITRWMAQYGAAFNIVGSLLGGWLASRFDPWRVLCWAALLRCVPLALESHLAGLSIRGPLADEPVIAIVCVEHLGSGLLTTSLFAFMMSRVDRTIGASHYTLLASVEVLGKFAGTLSGVLAARLGYAALFAGGALASVVLLLPLTRLGERPPGPPAKAVL
jgi:PAT family beta-lactamase induction signal transducer AmpG